MTELPIIPKGANDVFDFETLMEIFTKQIDPLETRLAEQEVIIDLMKRANYELPARRLANPMLEKAKLTAKLNACKQMIAEAIPRRVESLKDDEAVMWKYSCIKILSESLNADRKVLQEIEQEIDQLENSTVARSGVSFGEEYKGLPDGAVNKLKNLKDTADNLSDSNNNLEQSIETIRGWSIEQIQQYFKDAAKGITKPIKNADLFSRLLGKKDIEASCETLKELYQPMIEYSELCAKKLDCVEHDLKKDELTGTYLDDRIIGNNPEFSHIRHFTEGIHSKDGKLIVDEALLKMLKEEQEGYKKLPNHFVEKSERLLSLFPENLPPTTSKSSKKPTAEDEHWANLCQYDECKQLYDLEFSPVKDLPDYKEFCEKLEQYRNSKAFLFIGQAKRESLSNELRALSFHLNEAFREWVKSMFEDVLKMPDLVTALEKGLFNSKTANISTVIRERLQKTDSLISFTERKMKEYKTYDGPIEEKRQEIYRICGIAPDAEVEIPTYSTVDKENLFMEMALDLSEQYYFEQATNQMNQGILRSSQAISERIAGMSQEQLLDMRRMLGEIEPSINELAPGLQTPGDEVPSTAPGFPSGPKF